MAIKKQEFYEGAALHLLARSGGHPLLSMANVVCTPHLGYVEKQALESFYGGAIDSILGFAAGTPVNVLNPEAIGKRR